MTIGRELSKALACGWPLNRACAGSSRVHRPSAPAHETDENVFALRSICASLQLFAADLKSQSSVGWRPVVFGTALAGFEGKAVVEIHFMENRASLGKLFLVDARDVQFVPVVSRFDRDHLRGHTNSA